MQRSRFGSRAERRTATSWLRAVAVVTCGFVGAPIGTLLVTTNRAHADGLRCEQRLVSTGDTLYEVQAVCGAPDQAQHRTERRSVRRAVSVPCAAGLCTVMVEDAIEISVDEWTYDFGKHRFLQFLRFEQGTLVAVRSGGYGNKDT